MPRLKRRWRLFVDAGFACCTADRSSACTFAATFASFELSEQLGFFGQASCRAASRRARSRPLRRVPTHPVGDDEQAEAAIDEEVVSPKARTRHVRGSVEAERVLKLAGRSVHDPDIDGPEPWNKGRMQATDRCWWPGRGGVRCVFGFRAGLPPLPGVNVNG